MAPEQQFPDDPNRIDISLSLLSGQSGIAFDSFVTELKGLKETLAAMAQFSPAASAAGQQSAAAFYTNGMVSPIASRATTTAALADAVQGVVGAGPDEDAARAALAQISPTRRDPFAGPLPSLPPDANDEGSSDDSQHQSPVIQALGKVLPQKLSDAAQNAHQYLMGKTGGKLNNLATVYYEATGTIAASKALMDSISSHIPANPADVGYEQGYGGGTDIGAGGVGFRLPYDPFSQAGRKGIDIQFQQWKDRFSAGYNKQQAATTYGQLNDLGWYTLDSSFGPMKEALKKLTQWNPALGQNPGVAQMLDSSVRYGGFDDLSKFTQTIKDIPKAAQASHVSLNQMVQDMNAMGELNRQQGGSFYGGAIAAQQFSETTGLPPALLAATAENPYVQANLYNSTGLAPWQQGLATGDQRTQATVKSVLQMANAMGPQRGISHTDPYGFTTKVSGEELKEANVHMQFPQLPTSAIRQIIKHGNEMVMLPQLQQDTKHLTDLAIHDARVRWGKNPGDNAKVDREDVAGLPPAWIDNLSGGPKTDRARRAEAEYSHLAFGGGPGSMGALRRLMTDAGFSKKESKSVFDVDKGKITDPAQFAKDRQKKINDIITQHSKKFGDPGANANPKFTIELGKAARKVLHFVNSPQASAKASAGAGGPQANSSWVTGPTYTDSFGNEVQ